MPSSAPQIASLSVSTGESRIVSYPHLNRLFELESGSVDLVVRDSGVAPYVPVPAEIPTVTVPAGEACKSWDVLNAVLHAAVDAHLSRGSTILALGGGATTDLTAFAASIYLRGVAVVLVPTTLLGMVDAAIGGKTGIDFAGTKNVVGSFYPAGEVRIAPQVLRSLPDRDFVGGLAEAIKAALLGDGELLALLERDPGAVLRRDPTLLTEILHRAIRVKAGVVQEDFREAGTRAHLNLGHTFGHALESAVGLGTITHGEAVAWGIARAATAGVAAGLTDRAWAMRTLNVLQAYGYDTGPLPPDAPIDRVMAAMARDKKRTKDSLRFVIQTGAHETMLTQLSDDVVRSVLHGEGELQ